MHAQGDEIDTNSMLDSAYEFFHPMPPQVLQQLTGLEFVIGKFPKEVSSEEKPPFIESNESGEIIPIDGVLGIYDPKLKEIRIFKKGINWASKLLNVKPEHLEQVVKYHEWSHAIIHLGRDEKGKRCSLRLYNSIEEKLHETLAQLWTYQGLRWRVENARKEIVRQALEKLLEVFEVLSRRQPSEYKSWYKFRGTPLERIRKFTVALRNKWIVGRFDIFEFLIL